MNGIIFVIYGFSSSTQCYHQLMESTTHRSKQIAVVIMWISRGLRIYKLNCWDIYYTYMCICLVVIHTNTIFFRGIPACWPLSSYTTAGFLGYGLCVMRYGLGVIRDAFHLPRCWKSKALNTGGLRCDVWK